MKFNLINLSLISVTISSVLGSKAYFTKLHRDEDPKVGCLIIEVNKDSFHKGLDPKDKYQVIIDERPAVSIPMRRRDNQVIDGSTIVEIYGNTKAGVNRHIHSICKKIDYVPGVNQNDVELNAIPEPIIDAKHI